MRVSQKNSSIYNDLCPHAMAPRSFWKHDRYSGKIIEKNFFLLSLNWISYYVKIFHTLGLIYLLSLRSNYEAKCFLMSIVSQFY